MRRTMLRRLGWLAMVSLGAVACQSLPDVEPGICGNEIVDPGEDCDTVIPSTSATQAALAAGLACGAPDSATACRYDCTKSDGVCPTDYVCGTDFICRKPTGTFAELASLPVLATQIEMGDFDGDGRADLLTVDQEGGTIGVYFFEADGLSSRSFFTGSDGIAPAIGMLDSTKTTPSDDFVMALNGGVEVERGQTDRSFLPTDYPSFDIGTWDNMSLIATRAISTNGIDDDLLVLHWKLGDPFGKVYSPSAASAPGVDFSATPVLALPVPGPYPYHIPVGALDENDFNVPCDQFVLTDPNAPDVWIVAPCIRDTAGKPTWNNASAGLALQTTYPRVTLQGASATANTTAVMLAQMNPVNGGVSSMGRDDHLDLLIEAVDKLETTLYIAYGLGNGTFNSVPPMPGMTVGDNTASVWMPPLPPAMLPLAHLPLAVADFNDDGTPDYVLPQGLFQSVPMSTSFNAVATPLMSANWGEAIAVDFNGDGLINLVAGGAGEPGVQLFANTAAGVFNGELISTTAPATNFVTGDFDGDSNVDIAYRVGGLGGAASLELMFGRFHDYPESPQFLGALAGIDQLVSGVDLARLATPNAISDLVATTVSMTPPSTRAAAFVGRTDRTVLAPYFFRTDTAARLTNDAYALATGTFHTTASTTGATTQADVAALVLTPAGAYDISDAELWLLPTSGAAAFTGVSPSSLNLYSGAGGPKITSAAWESAVMAAIDVDHSGEDALAILVPNVTAADVSMSQWSTDSTLVVASVGSAGFQIGSMLPTTGQGLWNRLSQPSLAGPGGRRNVLPCVADIDGDGNPNLVFLAASGQGLGQPVIFFGTGQASSPFEVTGAPAVPVMATSVKGPVQRDVTGFTCMNVNGGKGTDLVMVTASTFDNACMMHTDCAEGWSCVNLLCTLPPRPTSPSDRGRRPPSSSRTRPGPPSQAATASARAT